jgi:hypothetical protein
MAHEDRLIEVAVVEHPAQEIEQRLHLVSFRRKRR